MNTPVPAKAQPNLNVPFFWPVQLASSMAEQGMALLARNVKFADEELRLHDGSIKPMLATAHSVRLKLRTLDLCDYSAPGCQGHPHPGQRALCRPYLDDRRLPRRPELDADAEKQRRRPVVPHRLAQRHAGHERPRSRPIPRRLSRLHR